MRRSSRLMSLASLAFAALLSSPAESQAPRVTIYEGARLIVGDGTRRSRTPPSSSRTISSRKSDARAKCRRQPAPRVSISPARR